MPFVSEPSGRPAILGISYPEFLVAVGNDFGLKSDDRDRFDSVQQAGTGWPEFHLLEQVKEINPFTIKPFFHLDAVPVILS